MHKPVLILNGNITRLDLSRTFLDGEYFSDLTVVDETGHRQEVSNVFCTNLLLEALRSKQSKEIFIWNSHVFAIRTETGLTDDINGVRRSFFHRDKLLLILLSCSIIMLPYVAWVITKKLSALGSLPKVVNGSIIA